jgi:hypothetical protein
MLFRISTKDFEELGLNLAGFEDRQNCATNNRRRFRGMYGVSPAALAEAFVDIQTTNVHEGRIDSPDPVLFLMAVEWLRTYKEEEELAGKFKRDEDTVRKYIWRYATAIQKLKEKKVSNTFKKLLLPPNSNLPNYANTRLSGYGIIPTFMAQT